jgi:hypothetical protein
MASLWSDLFKLFSYAAEPDPLSRRKDPRQFQSAGVAQPEAMGGDINNGQVSGGLSSFRQTNDMIDTTTLSNRAMRYKEYERLRNVPEIESALTVYADEACVAGDTPIATPFGFVTIKELSEKRADERFLAYCYDFEKKDYSLGWAFAPRKVKTAPTIKVMLDDGNHYTATADHRVLMRDGTWKETGDLKFGDELMPFYRVPASQMHTKLKNAQYPRVYSHNKGWVHERQFVDDWRTGKTSPEMEFVNKATRILGSGISTRKCMAMMNVDWHTVENRLHKEGFSWKEIKRLHRFETTRRVIGIEEGPVQDVYDLSVETHKCFATNCVILHNCQKDDDGNILKITTDNSDIKEELNFLFLNRKMLNVNRNGWVWFKNLCIMGDLFLELIINPENPKEGIYRGIVLPCETMYRIETVKSKLIEFQQSKEGPDYQAIVRGSVAEMSDQEIGQTTALRFAPNQIVHFRIGDDRKTFYPYGQSLIEPARGPAHSLRLMEDAMVVYRLVRAPERRVFYIDVGQLPPFKAESYLDRMKDQFRKRKVANNSGTPGANQVEERWMPPAQDEDYWIPIRPNSGTRIDTLPGAENLGEIDDAVYFRNKLLTALNFPKNYFNNEDPGATRITLSAQDAKFARMIERLQSHFEDGLLQIAERHLQLRGFPESSYRDLKIKMTPPSDWRELSRNEVMAARYNNAGALKGAQIMADYDIMTKILKFSVDDAEQMLARLKIQKLEDLKLQVLAQNPQLLGVGIPGQDQGGQPELGAEAGGPNAMPSPDGGALPGPDGQPPEGAPPEGAQPEMGPEGGAAEKTQAEPVALPEPGEEDIKKYDLELQDFDAESDMEDIDYSVED